NSQYRVNTYGSSSLYCDLTLPIVTPSGTGTFADPWNATNCLSQPVAGNVVRVKAGVSQPILTTDNDNIPVFQPANSGTVGNSIVYVTEWASVGLSSVATNANRTELRHSGVAPTISIPGGVGVGDGAAILGGNGKNYVVYDGFYIDVTHAYPKEDSGIIRDENTIGLQFKNIYIKGATLTLASNAVVWRAANSLDTVLYNIKTVDYINDGTGSATPQPSGWADAYGAKNFSLRHFEISNCGLGVFLKGSADSGAALNYGLIEYGYVDGGLGGIQLHALHGTNLTTVRYVRVSNYVRQAFFLSNEVVESQNILLDHVTAANGATDLGGADGGALYSVRGGGANDIGFASNITFTNSIFDSPVTAA
ncbi:MAG: hypothetical protein Q8S75_11765, partial [Nitrospirota bacterium]|nr:hypothetical protein [Nitrospirota bacterium]